jgi:anti-sigma factor RsiW
MRCSSSEPLLDEFVDGTLPLETHARVAAHAEECASCGSLLAELRVIDALLLAPRRLEPAPNFNFAVMAEVRSMPRPHASRFHALPVLGIYLAFAWSVIGFFFIAGKSAAHSALAFVSAALSSAASSFASVAAATSHLLAGQSLEISAAMAAILGFDLVAVAVAVVGLNVLRPRLAARAARSRGNV